MSRLNPNAAEFRPSWLQTGDAKGEEEGSWDDPGVVSTADELARVTMDKGMKSEKEKALRSAVKDRVGRKEDGGKVDTGTGGSKRRGGGHVDPSGNEDVVTEAKEDKEDKKESAETKKPNGLTEAGRMNGVVGHEAEDRLEVLRGDTKKAVNLVFIGHVDAGKSTISGHILYLTGNVDDRTMEKYEKEAKALNRESWKYAWALDTSEQERAKGKTEECGRASFETRTRRFIILDAPGHKNFVPHMIGGASQADIGILVISARKGEFETGFERGGQTREHAMLAKTSGVRQLIVVINKLDDPSIVLADGRWSEQRFDECKNKLEPFLKQVGWNPRDLVWIPVSGLTGDNLKDRVSKKICPWYTKGESLIDTLEHMKPPERLMNAPVKMPVYDKYREMGTVVMGKLQSGLIKVNDKLTMMPNRVDVVVDGMVLEGSEAGAALPGDNVRIRLKGVEEEDIRPGFVLCTPGHLVNYSKLFDAQLMILEHKSIICAGYSSVIHIHAAVEECVVEKLIAEIDRRTGKIGRRLPKFVKPGMKVIARIRLQQAVCVEPYNVFPQLGRFMLRDEGKTIAVGIIKKIRDTEGSATN